jgi:hypothetical protein
MSSGNTGVANYKLSFAGHSGKPNDSYVCGTKVEFLKFIYAGYLHKQLAILSAFGLIGAFATCGCI